MVASAGPDCCGEERSARRWRFSAARAVATIVMAGAVPLYPSPASAGTTFRVAALAPMRSTWGKIYATWAKAIEVKTSGRWRGASSTRAR